MRWKKEAPEGAFILRAFLAAMAFLWTAVVAGSFLWDFAETRRNTFEEARIQAEIAYDREVLFPPTPQVHGLVAAACGAFGRIASLRPLRLENAADPWETRALRALEGGKNEVVSVEPSSEGDRLRLMRPLVTEESCLKCHASQGYKVGEILGGISVSVPLAPLAALARRHLAVVGAAHLLFWGAGLAFIAVGGRRLALADRRRRAAEDELRRDRETLRLLYEGSPDAVAVIGRDHRVIYANQQAQKLTGTSLEALKNRTCHEGFFGAGAPCEGCLLEAVFEEGHPEGRVKHEVTVAGRENWLWQQWYPVRGADGRVDSVVEMARDITALKRAEVELQRHAAELEEANRIKDLFADIMSHDLLNPASAASLFLGYLRERETYPEGLRLIESVERNLDRMIRMIRNASSYSKLREMREIEMKVEDLGGIVREALDDLEPQVRAAGMTIDGPPAGSHPAAVNPLFTHVVANLVGNAVKYAAAGKRIAIGIAEAPGEWVLSVKDWGEGIPDEYKRSIFTRFERRNKEGVRGIGLGLAIAARIVELHGGRIWVEDNPEGGSVFLVALPREPDGR